MQPNEETAPVSQTPIHKGHPVDVTFENYSAEQAQINEKTAIAVASSGSVRTTFLPDVPTVKQAGGGDFEARSWNAITKAAAG